ncbi:MAG: hypothetical protein ACRDG6_05475 [Candidatus Limnocylindria bacterium]
MGRLRVFIVASVLGALALAACGSAGGGGLQNSAAPALGTNNPASPTPSGNPYSEPGY